MLAFVLGTLGLGGAFAAASIFVPGFLPLALSAAVSVVSFILRCKPCLIALAIFAAFVFGTVREHRIATAKCKAADIAMQLKAAQRDAKIAADTIELNKQQIQELATEGEALKKQRDDYAAIAKTGSCAIGDDRARRLRDITR